MNLSERQAAAVTRTGQDVCVVAGPGSGKTRVLVERFAWLVREQHVPPLRILAITFTEKAATQIKRRLASEFADDAVVREQVERASVSTVHGFCARLLREYPVEAGLDPEFQILDQPESARLLREAAHRALEDLYQQRRAEMRRLLGALNVSVREGARQPDIAEALNNIYQELRTAGRSVAELRQDVDRAAGGLTLAGFVAEVRGLMAAAPAKLTAKQAECLAALREWVDGAARAADQPASAEHFELLAAYPTGLPRGNGFEGYKAMRDERRGEAESHLAGEFFRPLKGLLLDALERLDACYREAKSSRGALDFSDLEERTIELLLRDRSVHDDVRNGFDQILMDELQDTNPLQWRLVDLLRRPAGFFAVGDVNQSIYGFRYAAPDAFLKYRDQVRADGGVIDELNENYRSREEILTAAERVLEGAPGVEARRLEARREFGPAGEPPVEVIAGPEGEADEAAAAEARGVARRIAALVGRLMVQDGPGRQRPLRFRDVAVLVRASSSLPPLQDALRQTGIPFLTEGGKTFFETREARDLAMLLRAIADPGDETALAGVLRSPLAGVSDEALLRRKLQLDQEDGEDRERLARFEALLDELRAESGDVPPDVLLARAMDACDYESGLDTRARAGVDKFLAIVRTLHQRQPGSLRGVVEDLEWRRAEASEAEAPPDDSSDTVRVMTVHQAKGLEFPVVFLPALHRGPGGGDPVVGMAPQGGLGVHWRNPVTGRGVKDPAFRLAAAEREAREAEEENRLLFVAMTRAEEHLALSFARTKNPKGPHLGAVAGRLGVSREADSIEPVELLLAPDSAGNHEPLLIAAPALSGQYDSSLSVTSLGLYAQCPRRYFLGRYLGWDGVAERAAETPPPSGPGGAEFGTLVHDLLAGSPVENPPEEALDLVRRFQASELGERAARAARVEREFSFTMAVEDVVLTGQIDLWFEEGGELVLVDFKTDRVTPGEEARHAGGYARQVRLYALALQRLLGRAPARAALCFLRTGEVVPVSMGAKEMDDAAGLVRQWKSALETVKFEMREGRQCERCPFVRTLCPAPGRE